MQLELPLRLKKLKKRRLSQNNFWFLIQRLKFTSIMFKNKIFNLYRRALASKRYRLIAIGLTLLYLFSPIDFIPELLLPPLGFIDDAVLLGVFLSEMSKLRNNKK